MTARIYQFPPSPDQLALFSREECGAVTPPPLPYGRALVAGTVWNGEQRAVICWGMRRRGRRVNMPVPAALEAAWQIIELFGDAA